MLVLATLHGKYIRWTETIITKKKIPWIAWSVPPSLRTSYCCGALTVLMPTTTTTTTTRMPNRLTDVCLYSYSALSALLRCGEARGSVFICPAVHCRRRLPSVVPDRVSVCPRTPWSLSCAFLPQKKYCIPRNRRSVVVCISPCAVAVFLLFFLPLLSFFDNIFVVVVVVVVIDIVFFL